MLIANSISGWAQSRGSLVFETKQWQHDYAISNSSFSPKYKHDIKLSYASAGDEKVKNFVNREIIITALGEKYGDLSTEQAVEKYLTDKTNLYVKDIQKEYNEDKQRTSVPVKDLIRRYSYSMKFSTQLLSYWNSMLVYQFTWFDSKYDGNGLIGSQYVNLDLYNFKVLTYHNIFKKGTDSQVTQLIKESMLEYFGVESEEEIKDLGADITRLKPAEKFVLEPKGIRFIYEPYELNSDARGDLNITIPYSALKQYMNTNNTAIRMIVAK